MDQPGYQPDMKLEGSPVTDLNVAVGTVVKRNTQWDSEWGDETIHPPHNITGVVLGYTNSSCEPTGDHPTIDFGNIARVLWDGYEGSKDVRIGFADEFWLEVVSGAVHRELPPKPIEFDGLFDCRDGDSGYPMCRLRQREDTKGQPVVYVPPAQTEAEAGAEIQLQLFWRIHAGDVEAVRRILAENPQLLNVRIQPCEFPDAAEFPWPYSHFDGEYNDTPAMLACRYCHTEMLQLLLEMDADTSLANDAGGTCASIAATIPELAMYEFSDPEGAAGAIKLLPDLLDLGFHAGVTCDRSGQYPIVGNRYNLKGQDYDVCEGEFLKMGEEERIKYTQIQPPPLPASPPAVLPSTCGAVCVRGSACELSTCVDASGAGIKWLLVNGHSDPEQIDYCQNMVDQWHKTLSQRGDTIETELSCPTKAEFSAALQSLFQSAAGAASGLFVICHGGEQAGEWVSFNQANEHETFGWEDIEAAGLYEYPAQLFVVGDSCYSAKMGKTGFAALRSRHLSGEWVPVCSMLMASEKPEKNFSCMFALEAMRSRRKLSRAACEKVVAKAPALVGGTEPTIALEVVEDITVSTNDFDPFFFFYAPIDSVTADSIMYTL